MSILFQSESIEDFRRANIMAFTTTRQAGTFAMTSDEPTGEVMARWWAVAEELFEFAPRFATANQVHGKRVVSHHLGWEGWLRVPHADGHFAPLRGITMAVTVADCVPVFIGHGSGAIGLLHAGWRGTAGQILEAGLDAFRRVGRPVRDLAIHLGPAICGSCYEVGPDVYAQLTGRTVEGPTCVDLRAILADQARHAGVRKITISPWCTRCHNDKFFSHRAGDTGRHLSVLSSYWRDMRVFLRSP